MWRTNCNSLFQYWIYWFLIPGMLYNLSTTGQSLGKHPSESRASVLQSNLNYNTNNNNNKDSGPMDTLKMVNSNPNFSSGTYNKDKVSKSDDDEKFEEHSSRTNKFSDERTTVQNDNSKTWMNVALSESSESEKVEIESLEQKCKTQRKSKEQDEKILLENLMTGYEKNVRPVRNASQPVIIKLGITLTQIFDMDEKNQVLTTSVWLDQQWYDELLRWKPSEFFNITAIRLPCEKIWVPDIVLYNSADDYTRGYMPSRAMVKHDGEVFWPPPTKFRSTCQVDVRYFPFDDQICKLKLGSWTYNGYELDITNSTEEVDLTNYLPNGEWDLLKAVLQRNVVNYSCCPEPFPDVTITLIIRRKTLYYFYNVIAPCVMLSILTLLVFYLPPDSGEKVALGVTVLLAFSVFMLAIAEKMPETSDSIPLIGIYLTTIMGITSVSVISTVAVLNLHYLGPRVRPVPQWIRFFLPIDDQGFIYRQREALLANNFNLSRREDSTKRSEMDQNSEMGQLSPTNQVLITANDYPGNGHSINVLTRLNREQVSNNHSKQGPSAPNSLSTNPNAQTAQNRRRINQNQQQLDPTESEAEKVNCYESSLILQELLHHTQYLVTKQKHSDEQKIMVSEWRLVAQLVDRILLWSFLIITLVSSGILIVILPIYKHSWQGPTRPQD